MKRHYAAIVFALILVTAIVLAILVALHGKAARSGNLPGTYSTIPKSAFDLAQEDAMRRVVSLFSIAPDFAHVNFGPGARSVAYRVTWILRDALVAPDGTLYVTVTPPNNLSNIDRYSVGTLFLGRLHLIPLPPLREGYVAMGFIGNGSPPMIQASNNKLGPLLFVLTPYSATKLPIREVGQTRDMGVLTTGEHCDQPKNINSPYVLLAVSQRGLLRSLVTRSALQQATRGLISDDRLISMYCTSFGGQDFVTLSEGNFAVVFRLNGNKLQLMSRGRVFGSGRRHMLIWQTEDSPQGATGFQDYLEVIR